MNKLFMGMKSKLFVLLIAIAALQGCVHVPVATIGSEAAKETMSFSAAKDESVVYLYWDPSSDYKGFAEDVSFNDKYTVTTLSNSLGRVVLKPGKYNVLIELPEMTASNKMYALNAEAGKVYFLRMKLRSRIMIGGVTTLTPVKNSEALSFLHSNMLTLLVPKHFK